MSKKDKINWILNYIKEHDNVNVLDSEFHEIYIENCKPNKTDWHMLDFQIAPELNRYLSEMFKDGLISRTKISRGYRERHAPSYVFLYSIKDR